MPKLNPTHLLAGVAGVPSSIDLVQIAIANVQGDASWLTSTLAVVQAGTDATGYQMVRSDGLVLAPVGAFFNAASGTGAFRTEHTVPNEKPIAGAEGFIACIANYSGGVGLKLYRDDNSVAWQDLSAAISGPPSRNCAIRDGIVSAFLNGDWELTEIATGTPVPFQRRTDGVDWLVPSRDANGSVVLLERSDTYGLTLRKANVWKAEQLLPPSQQIFNPDIIRRGETYAVVYSVTLGEEIPNVRQIDVTDEATYPLVDTNPNPGIPPVIPPQPPTGATVPAVVVTKPMFYANGDMKTVIRTKADALPKLKKGDTIQVVKP